MWKQTFPLFSSVLTHHGASWQCPLLDPEECSAQITPESSQILRFQESEDYQQCDGITLYLISATPISGRRSRCGLNAVTTSQISPMELRAPPLGTSLLLQL